ncbi:ATPase [Butyrivibrio sp. INlla18]|uniref:ATP-binding protein n=1 Tax=Butyrivibrio sp. INlla18 TaxID=1520806 RepID=UPI00088E7151|nr:ATP-binding protein [Butyrivibrio sp. INlla18]SDA75954.1 ATPase [Butyrivibrio sp. INlla18]
MERNPFVLNFGKVPKQYISREFLIDEIVQDMTEDDSQNNCFMLTGTRGSGKTVTMTAIEQKISESDDWIVVRLNAERNMLESLVAKLYDSREFMTKFVDANLNLSKFGIGLNISTKSPVADIESALELLIKEIKRKKKKLLVSVDEVSDTVYMREFVSSFQILIRENLPVFLLMAGLYENISDLKDEKNLTFLYRTPQYEMEPLNLTLIADRYSTLFGISREKAMDMAIITKGYPFAYQALGKYIWDEKDHEITDSVMLKFDDALSHYVYKKMWSELSEKDKWFMSFIVKKESMPVSELLEITGQKKNEFSQYRERLRDKGLIDVSARGIIKYKLPRFDTFVNNMQMEI